ncbi:MAG TPA: hypothetical protein VN712_00525, partial [Dermatophilaceae bacterium]|nr:hypothetical protein [Dermatophilaceae bacterium]
MIIPLTTALTVSMAPTATAVGTAPQASPAVVQASDVVVPRPIFRDPVVPRPIFHPVFPRRPI